MHQNNNKKEPNKSRGRSNISAGSVSSTLGEMARFIVNGQTISQEEFWKLHINGFK